jgi:hypothetical protein
VKASPPHAAAAAANTKAKTNGTRMLKAPKRQIKEYHVAAPRGGSTSWTAIDRVFHATTAIFWVVQRAGGWDSLPSELFGVVRHQLQGQPPTIKTAGDRS